MNEQLPEPTIAAVDPGLDLSGPLGRPMIQTVPDTPEHVFAPASGRWIFLLVVATFGTFIAFITPLALSLSIQIKVFAPDHEEYLGYVLGIGALASLVFGPLLGQLSDRTRSRLGRRRPWIIIGLVVGTVGLVIMGTATAVWGLALGWVVAQLGYNQVASNLVALQADKLPATQRGRVAGLTGMATLTASVAGAILGGGLAGQPLLLFVGPGVVAIVLAVPFILFAGEADSRAMAVEGAFSLRTILGKYVFNPKTHADFSWNWVGRFAFYFGLTLNTTYTAFFYASRLHLPVDEVGGTVAIAGLVGVAGTIGGALASGFISDKLRRRKPFVLAGAAFFSVGSLITGFAPDLALILVGALVANIGVGIFSSVDQALLLDVLPERGTDAARFISITQFSIGIPQTLAPVIASGLLTLGVATGGDKNYLLLYLLAAALTILGGLIILKVKAVR